MWGGDTRGQARVPVTFPLCPSGRSCPHSRHLSARAGLGARPGETSGVVGSRADLGDVPKRCGDGRTQGPGVTAGLHCVRSALCPLAHGHLSCKVTEQTPVHKDRPTPNSCRESETSIFTSTHRQQNKAQVREGRRSPHSGRYDRTWQAGGSSVASRSAGGGEVRDRGADRRGGRRAPPAGSQRAGGLRTRRSRGLSRPLPRAPTPFRRLRPHHPRRPRPLTPSPLRGRSPTYGLWGRKRAVRSGHSFGILLTSPCYFAKVAQISVAFILMEASLRKKL